MLLKIIVVLQSITILIILLAFTTINQKSDLVLLGSQSTKSEVEGIGPKAELISSMSESLGWDIPKNSVHDKLDRLDKQIDSLRPLILAAGCSR